MKPGLLPVILIFITVATQAQNQFTLKSRVGSMQVRVNGQEYFVDSIGTQINTQYPGFDTLIFLAEGPNSEEPVFCNFKPDSVYAVSLACCGSLDLFPASRFEYDSLFLWDYREDFGRIQNHLMDRPFLSIRTKHPPTDSLYAWHADASCITEYKMIDTATWQLGVPPKCFYWTNITYIRFFKQDERLASKEESHTGELLDIPNVVELSSIAIRLFDNERFVIVYNERTNQITLEYE